MKDMDTKPLIDQAFDALLTALRSGALRSGTFASNQGLSRELGFPLASIREATKRAEAQGLLEILPKRGSVVMDAGPEITRSCMDMRVVLDKEGARRIILGGAKIALDQLESRHEDLLARARKSATPELSAEAISVDLSLHDALASGLGNDFLAESYAANRNRIAIIQHTRPFLADRIVSAMEEHLEIIAVLRHGDNERVCTALDHHFRQTLRWWGVDLRQHP